MKSLDFLEKRLKKDGWELEYLLSGTWGSIPYAIKDGVKIQLGMITNNLNYRSYSYAYVTDLDLKYDDIIYALEMIKENVKKSNYGMDYWTPLNLGDVYYKNGKRISIEWRFEHM